MSINAFHILLALANTPTIAKIIEYLELQVDNLTVSTSTDDFKEKFTQNKHSCIITDSAFITSQDNNAFIKSIMESNTPTVTIIQGQHLPYVFDYVYNPPTHEYVSFPLALEDLSYMLYTTVAGFRKKVFEMTKVDFIQQQLQSVCVTYPSQQTRFTHAAVYAPLNHIIQFSRRALFDARNKWIQPKSFIQFLEHLKNIAERIEFHLDRPINEAEIASLKLLNQEMRTIVPQITVYQARIKQYNRDTYIPYQALLEDIAIATTCVNILLQIKQAPK